MEAKPRCNAILEDRQAHDPVAGIDAVCRLVAVAVLLMLMIMVMPVMVIGAVVVAVVMIMMVLIAMHGAHLLNRR